MLPLLTRIDHVGIACRDLTRTVELYRSTFGLQVVSWEVHPDQGVREAMLRVCAADGPLGVGAADGPLGVGAADGPLQVGAADGPLGVGAADGPLGASYIQLLEPLAPDTPVGKFIARRGEGIHHVGYGVADVRQALAAIGGTGIRLIDERPRHGSMGASIAFLHPADLGGVLTELVQATAGA